MAPAHTPVSPSPKPAALPVLPQELLELCANLGRRLRDLETFQVPELAGCKGPLTLHEELASNVRGEMVGVRRDLEELKLQVDDLDKARDRKAGQELVAGVQTRINAITQLYRNAVLSSKRQIDNLSQASARDVLFHSASKPNGKARSTTAPTAASADDALMAATSDVTEGLRRTMQLMQQELDRSLVSNEILESSTATMQMTSDQYSTFSTLLTTSKALITSLERADFLDRLILLFALLFFGLCCAWIFKRRVVDKGLRVAGAMGRVVAGGKGKDELKRSVQEVVETIAAVTAAATAVVQSVRKEVPTAAITAVVKGHQPVWVNTTVDLAAFSRVVEPVEAPLAVPTNAESEKEALVEREEVETPSEQSSGVVEEELGEAQTIEDAVEEEVVVKQPDKPVFDVEDAAAEEVAAEFDLPEFAQLPIVANASLQESSPTENTLQAAVEEYEREQLAEEEAEVPLVEQAAGIPAEAEEQEPDEQEKVFVAREFRPATPIIDAQAAIDANLVVPTSEEHLPLVDTLDTDEAPSPATNDTPSPDPSDPLDDQVFVPHVLRPAGTPFDENLIFANAVPAPVDDDAESVTAQEDVFVEPASEEELSEPILLEALLEEAAEPVVREEAEDVVVSDPSSSEELDGEDEVLRVEEEEEEVQEGEDDYDLAEEEGEEVSEEEDDFEALEPGWELEDGEEDGEEEEEELEEGSEGFSGEVMDALEREGAEEEVGGGHLRDEL